jgi:hypothetical protein
VDLERSRLLAQVVPVADRAEPSDGEPPVPGFRGVQQLLDVRAALALPWKPASYLMTLLLHEQTSNRLHVRLGPSPRAYRDPEVERFLEQQRLRQPPPPVTRAPGTLALAWRRQPASPEVPAAGGIVLQADRVVVQREGAVHPLLGSFRLPIRPWDVVRPFEDRGKQVLPDVGDPAAKAVATIALLLISAAPTTIVSVELRVPVYELEPADPPVASGHFKLDLMRLTGFSDRTQTYFVYAFAGEVMAGPVLTALVDEAELPGR